MNQKYNQIIITINAKFMFTIAIVGRPNVGKSTLFNKLAGEKIAIVNNFSGVTRDRKEAAGYLGPMKFNMIDTAGWGHDIDKNELEFRMVEQTNIAIKEADLCLFVVDYRSGIVAEDKFFAEKLRKSNIKVVLIANKCEGSKGYVGFDNEYYKLGFGEPVGISAEHKDGFNFLYDAIEPFYNEYMNKTKDLEEVNDIDIDNKTNDDKPIQITIVGRPNAGKSTLINQLLNEERVITGPEAGITRDPIAIDWEYKGRKIKLVDTAGIRKRKNINNELEKVSVEESMKSIVFSQIVILMMDAKNCFDAQDLAISSKLIKEGRGVVFALNKWDEVENKQELMNRAIYTVEKYAPEIKGAPIVPISALNGTNIDKLLKAVFDVYNAWNKYIKTADLNKWLSEVQEIHTPPMFRGKATKLKYITQIKRRPPTFTLFTNSPERLKNTAYDRYLVNSLRENFKLNGTVIRILLRKSDNPFDKKK